MVSLGLQPLANNLKTKKSELNVEEIEIVDKNFDELWEKTKDLSFVNQKFKLINILKAHTINILYFWINLLKGLKLKE